MTLVSYNNSIIEKFIQHSIDEYDKQIQHLENDKIENDKKNIILCPVIEKSSMKTRFWSCYRRFKYNNDVTFAHIFLNQKKEIINHIEKFQDKSYTKLNKMSFLLHGPPGTGKTTFIRCLANYLNRTIVYVKLSDIKTINQLYDIFYSRDLLINTGVYCTQRDNLSRSDKIIVFEDIDAECPQVLKREEKLTEKKQLPVTPNINEMTEKLLKKEDDDKLTLSDILQIFDGIIKNDNIVTIMTTNHKEKLDPALIRPGRVTMDLHLDTLNNETCLEMIESFFPNEKIETTNIKNIKASELENLCNQSVNVENLNELYEKYITEKQKEKESEKEQKEKEPEKDVKNKKRKTLLNIKKLLKNITFKK